MAQLGALCISNLCATKPKVTENVALDLAYRYVDAGETDVSKSFEGTKLKNTADLVSHDYSLGVRYNF